MKNARIRATLWKMFVKNVLFVGVRKTPGVREWLKFILIKTIVGACTRTVILF